VDFIGADRYGEDYRRTLGALPQFTQASKAEDTARGGEQRIEARHKPPRGTLATFRTTNSYPTPARLLFGSILRPRRWCPTIS
jgi:hypothetical protein